jgi:hypothetical protein
MWLLKPESTKTCFRLSIAHTSRCLNKLKNRKRKEETKNSHEKQTKEKLDTSRKTLTECRLAPPPNSILAGFTMTIVPSTIPDGDILQHIRAHTTRHLIFWHHGNGHASPGSSDTTTSHGIDGNILQHIRAHTTRHLIFWHHGNGHASPGSSDTTTSHGIDGNILQHIRVHVPPSNGEWRQRWNTTRHLIFWHHQGERRRSRDARGGHSSKQQQQLTARPSLTQERSRKQAKER